MKHSLFLWTVWLLFINIQSLKACRGVADLITGGGAGPIGNNLLGGMMNVDPRLRQGVGLIGRLVRNLLGDYQYPGQYPNTYGQYGTNQAGTYPGGVVGGNPLYNQQPLASPYYPNQLVGSNIQGQPMVGSTQPYLGGQMTQPVVAGTTYPNTIVQPQPVVNPIVNPVVQPMQG